ncbi:hypothetical protein AAKU55_005590 [Oxalobacteraceae bacterium GrIS 1.11]
MNEFAARMDNWRRVVLGNGSGASGAACAAWAKWYVALRVSEPAPALDLLEERIKPLRGLVTADQLDGWMVEAAWRLLGDYNDRQALKFLYIHQWPENKIRRHLVGVRGPHVPLVVARARNNLMAGLKKMGSADIIASTTCLPGCPVPTVESTLP